jgi:hypothetical protein
VLVEVRLAAKRFDAESVDAIDRRHPAEPRLESVVPKDNAPGNRAVKIAFVRGETIRGTERLSPVVQARLELSQIDDEAAAP